MAGTAIATVGPMIVATYRLYRLWRLQMLGGFAVFGVFGFFLLAETFAGHDGPPIWFAILWLLALAWNSYWFLFRIAYRLDLTATDLTWRAPLRAGSVRTADLVEMRPHVFASSIEVVLSAQGVKVLVLVQKGFRDFTQDVQAIAPQIKVRIGFYASIVERLPGLRGYRRPPKDPPQ